VENEKASTVIKRTEGRIDSATNDAEFGRILSVIRAYVFSAAGILAVAGVAKVWTAFSHIKYLVVVDPITGFSYEKLMLLVGLFELVAAGFCLLNTVRRRALGLIAWLATCFLAYRVGYWWIGWRRPCGCMGSLSDALHIDLHTANTAMTIILAYLLIGSYGILFWLWKQNKKSPL
jgi:hypothetical protein